MLQSDFASPISSHPDALTTVALKGRLLHVVRIAWLAIAGLVFGLFIVGAPRSYAIAHTLRPETIAGLEALGLSADFPAVWLLLIDTMTMVGFGTIALLIFRRQSENPMALFVALMLLLTGMIYTAPAFESGMPLVWMALLTGLTEFCQVSFVFLFPNGRFVPPWSWLLLTPLIIWRPLFWGLIYLPYLLSPGRTGENYPHVPQNLPDIISLWSLFLIGIGLQIYRYRTVSNPVQRQQTKWLLWGMVGAIIMVGSYAIGLNTIGIVHQQTEQAILWRLFGRTIRQFSLLLVPVTVAYSILRYRLWEIDDLINRTLLYSLLTALLAAIYFGSVILLRQLFGVATGQSSPVAVAISTLFLAAIFQPLRGRVQNWIDQSFYRRRYNATQTVAEFAYHVRNEVDIDKLTTELLDVVQTTMQPTTAGLWLLEPELAKGLSPNDPLVAYFQSVTEPVELDRLPFASPVLASLRMEGVKLIAPVIGQGEMIGVLTLGPRHGEQDYSFGDRQLLNVLASQVAPALRVAQLVRRQQTEAVERERIEQELRTAHKIQQALLPKSVPSLAGWQLEADYQSARAVGGDFYDFLPFPDGRMGIVIGDVSGKGMPAALVMAATRTILRSVAQPELTPGQVLQRVNDLLQPDMTAHMFATCFYAILNPATGELSFANAGHNLPYLRTSTDVVALRATGMPLGLLAEMTYEERTVQIMNGECVLFYSDGLVEAHNADRAMFGSRRLQAFLAGQDRNCPAMLGNLLAGLASFTGADIEQEDDITLVALHRS